MMNRYPWRNTSEDIAEQTPSQWETPSGAQAKADAAEAAAKEYSDEKLAEHVGAGGDAHALAVPDGEAGFISGADQAKLNGIEEHAEVNQNAFAQVNNVVAASESDTLTIAGGTGITISTNPTTKTVTVTATGEATPGPHGSSHNNDGSDPIPELVALRDEFADVTAHLADTMACFGDSFTRTVSDANAPTEREQFETYLWFDLVCDTLKPVYKKNNGVSGSRCADVSRTLHSIIRNDVHYNRNLLQIGYNDLTDFKGLANANEDIANKIQTMCIYLKTRKRKSDFNSHTWLWIDNDELGYALNSTTGKLGLWYVDGGAPIQFSFTGRYLVIFTVDNVNSGTYLVKSDGVTVFNANIKRNKILGFAPYCLKVDCGSAGTHTIQFSSPDGRAYIAGYGEYDSSIKVYVNQITKRTDTTYDADTDSINGFIATRISELADANVKVVSMANFNPSLYVGPDTTHPNILGHMIIAENVLSSINS